MDAGAGIVSAGGVLLMVSGCTKLWRPASTLQALRAVGVQRMNTAASRLLSGVEIGLGAAIVLIGGRWMSALGAAIYLGFAAFVVVAIRKSAPTCGCTGRTDTPPNASHVVVCGIFASVSAIVAVAGGRTGVIALLGETNKADLLVLLGYSVVVTWLAWMTLTTSRSAYRHQH